MQDMAEARSFENRIEFYIREKNLVIVAKRDENGEVIIEKKEISKPEKKKKSLATMLTIFVIALVCGIFVQFLKTIGGQIAFFLVIAWLLTSLYYILKKPDSSFKYHAAEHKVLNYFDKYNKAPEKIEDIMKMPSISYRCGSTIVAVVLVMLTSCTLGVLFIPMVLPKILGCIVCVFLTLCLWANEKLDFFQKLVIEEPSKSEVEVAFYGVKEYLKEKSSGEQK